MNHFDSILNRINRETEYDADLIDKERKLEEDMETTLEFIEKSPTESVEDADENHEVSNDQEEPPETTTSKPTENLQTKTQTHTYTYTQKVITAFVCGLLVVFAVIAVKYLYSAETRKVGGRRVEANQELNEIESSMSREELDAMEEDIDKQLVEMQEPPRVAVADPPNQQQENEGLIAERIEQQEEEENDNENHSNNSDVHSTHSENQEQEHEEEQVNDTIIY